MTGIIKGQHFISLLWSTKQFSFMHSIVFALLFVWMDKVPIVWVTVESLEFGWAQAHSWYLLMIVLLVYAFDLKANSNFVSTCSVICVDLLCFVLPLLFWRFPSPRIWFSAICSVNLSKTIRLRVWAVLCSLCYSSDTLLHSDCGVSIAFSQ